MGCALKPCHLAVCFYVFPSCCIGKLLDWGSPGRSAAFSHTNGRLLTLTFLLMLMEYIQDISSVQFFTLWCKHKVWSKGSLWFCVHNEIDDALIIQVNKVWSDLKDQVLLDFMCIFDP